MENISGNTWLKQISFATLKYLRNLKWVVFYSDTRSAHRGLQDTKCWLLRWCYAFINFFPNNNLVKFLKLYYGLNNFPAGKLILFEYLFIIIHGRLMLAHRFERWDLSEKAANRIILKTHGINSSLFQLGRIWIPPHNWYETHSVTVLLVSSTATQLPIMNTFNTETGIFPCSPIEYPSVFCCTCE